jgi:hypothetical protein
LSCHIVIQSINAAAAKIAKTEVQKRNTQVTLF